MNRMISAHLNTSLIAVLAPLLKNLKEKQGALHGQILAMVLVLLTFAACDHNRGTTALAEIQETGGNAFLLGPASRIKLIPGATISEAQTIETDRDATVTVSLMPGLMLRLKPESSLSIQKLLLVKSGIALEYPMKSRQAHLQLTRGSLCGSTPPIITHVDLRILTPAGTAIVPALTVFSLSLQDDKVRGVVARGQLTFRSKNGAAGEIVAERQFAEWNSSSGAAVSAPQNIETDHEALQDLTVATQFGGRAAELIAKARNTRPPGR
jgi:hypothetical protein